MGRGEDFCSQQSPGGLVYKCIRLSNKSKGDIIKTCMYAL